MDLRSRSPGRMRTWWKPLPLVLLSAFLGKESFASRNGMEMSIDSSVKLTGGGVRRGVLLERIGTGDSSACVIAAAQVGGEGEQASRGRRRPYAISAYATPRTERWEFQTGSSDKMWLVGGLRRAWTLHRHAVQLAGGVHVCSGVISTVPASAETILGVWLSRSNEVVNNNIVIEHAGPGEVSRLECPCTL